MPVTQADIVNQGLQLMGGNTPPVTGTSPNFSGSGDGAAAAVAANYLYAPCVAFVGRQFEWDFSRAEAALTLSGNTAPSEWDFEYLYPTNALQVWQLKPGTIADPYDPLPTTWVRANVLVGSTQTAVIWTDVASAVAVYNNNPDPSIWDAGFTMAVVRLLASEFAIALAGRPDTSKVLMDSSAMMGDLAKSRDT